MRNNNNNTFILLYFYTFILLYFYTFILLYFYTFILFRRRRSRFYIKIIYYYNYFNIKNPLKINFYYFIYARAKLNVYIIYIIFILRLRISVITFATFIYFIIYNSLLFYFIFF